VETRKKILLLLIIVAATALVAVAATIALLYHAALKEERARLTETAQSQARLIEAVARFDGKYSAAYPGNPFEATLSQVLDAHKQYKGFGKTGEFTLARRKDNDIVFLLSHRHYDLQNPKPVRFDSDLAEPMRRALSGLSGTVVGLDYRGRPVLAAHEPVGELALGIVAKIDLAEVRAPFIRAGIIAGGITICVVLIAMALFLKVSNPIVQRLDEYSRELEKSVNLLQESERELTIRNRISQIFLTMPHDEVYAQVLTIIRKAFKSKYGFFGYIDDMGNLVCPSMTRNIWDECRIPNKNIVFPRESWGGLWGRSLVENIALFSNTRLKVPEGHVPLNRALVVPIMYRENIIGQIAVANKETDYDQNDQRLLKKIASTIAPILHARLQRDREERDRRLAEEALRNARNELEKRVEDRTAELVRVNRTLEAEIKERKRAEGKARKNRKRFQDLWDNAPVAYHTLDASGVITSVNNTEVELLGYTKAEILGKPIFQFIVQEQRKEAEGRFAEKLTGKQVPKHENRIYMKKDGSRMYVSIDDVLEYDREGNVTGVRTTMVDVTDRKRAEDALQESEDQLRRLSSQLLNVQEEERKRIAMELHDSTGQSLAAIKFVAENALSQIDKHDKTAGVESLKTLIPLVQQAAQEVRRIHTDLRPSLLDDLGITSTISWFCREFENVYRGISIEKRIEIEENNVPEPLKIVIFRILQEAMNNVAKYGRADLIRISLVEKGTAVEIVIEDNGQGFDVHQARTPKGPQGGFGMTSMKERTELAGGTLSVESNPGAGTTIRASWPLQQ
jgi:PAS domain S-box-containing protein